MKRLGKILQNVSNLGISHETAPALRRPIRLSNQVNLILLLISVIFISSEFFGANTPADQREFSLLLLVLIILVAFIHLFAASLGMPLISRLLLILDFPLIIFFFPAFSGRLQEQDLFWFPYIMVTVSIIPQIILQWEREKGLYIFSLIYMFAIVWTTDLIIMQVIPEEGTLREAAMEYQLYYKRSVIVAWAFINLCIFYLKYTLARTEKELEQAHSELIHRKEPPK